MLLQTILLQSTLNLTSKTLVAYMSLLWLLAKIPFSCPHIDFGFPIAMLLSLLLSHKLQEIQNWMQSQLII